MLILPLPPACLQHSWDFTFKSKHCLVCGEVFKIAAPCRYEVINFCSKACANLNHSKQMLGRNNPNFRHGNIKVCIVCGKKFFDKTRSLNRKYCDLFCSRSTRIGELAPAWIGGITAEKHYRSTKVYQDWRKAVLKRDKYTCLLCREKSHQVQAHHIKMFALYPELRAEISNGATLCRPCHHGIRGKEHFYEMQLTLAIA